MHAGAGSTTDHISLDCLLVRFASLALWPLLVAPGVLAVACNQVDVTPVGTSPTPEAGADAGVDADAGLPPLENAPPAEIPAAQRLDTSSSPVVYDGPRGKVWTANGDVGSISLVDVDAATVITETPIGTDIRSVALSPDGKWIAAVDRQGATVTLVDAATQQVARAIPVGTHPHAAVWDAWNPRWLYVSLEDDNGIAVIDRTLGVYTQTVPVGRLPAGVSVSAQRHELYVTQRTDGSLTRVSLDKLTVASTVVLAPTPPNSAPTTPQGLPFGLEGVSMLTDGVTMWVPHELFAPTHPFQFTQTVFPAVSVVDWSSGGAEVFDNATDLANGISDGRKLLFADIAIPGPTGATTIVSQPCAVAVHPNGVVAYVVDCGSEDLLTFDLTQGIAITVLQNLPGDHPVGIAVDTAGERAFVVSDQTHTLVRLDLAGGDLTQVVSIIGSTIPLVAMDPVAPNTRAGRTLFFRANSSKGTLPTSGNNWLSCAACHLDGFTTTNQFLFEGSHIADEALDAQIGHVGLADLFSTAPTPTATSFNPHDLLVAFEDMGGLAPDRTGANRTGQVDPSAPTVAAATMAAQVATVVAQDLPQGPAWLSSDSMPNNATYDTSWCGNCHQAQYTAWQLSAHAHAGEDPMVKYCVGVENSLVGTQFSRFCAGCHDPVSERLGDTSFQSGRGVTCLGCHEVSRTIRAGGNADLEATGYDWTLDHAARAAADLARLRTPAFCGGCHEQFVPGTGLPAIGTLSEWEAGPYAAANPPTACVDCHMPRVNGVADHRAVGGNVYLGTQFANAAFVDALKGNLSSAASLSVTQAGSDLVVTVTNQGSGHGFPTGVTDIREPWVQLEALDGSGNLLAAYGGPDATGLLPPTAARLGIDIAEADGTLLYKHEVTQATRIPFDQRIASRGTLDLVLPMPASLPPNIAELDAVLYYHNVRTTYYQAATGTATSAPQVEMARVKVQ
jgi:DNA-binding beta-propeller fold protein YncE